MIDSEVGWMVISRIADIVGVVAFAVVGVGIWSSFVSRPRLHVQAVAAGETLVARVDYAKGSRSARNLNVMLRGIDGRGHALMGDDSIWRRAVLSPGEGHWISLYNAFPPELSLQPDPNAVRIEVPAPSGILLAITWDHALLPGRRDQRVVLWTQDEREKALGPAILTGRRAAAAVLRAMTSVGQG